MTWANLEEWPWEGAVQDVFAELLMLHGWQIDRLANTASREHGVDVIAHKGERRLGGEVKGFPLEGYADPKRVGEKKRAKPNGQAKISFGKAIHAALILRDAQPSWESLVVLPDTPRYRELLGQTQRSPGSAEVHVVLVTKEGGYSCQTWSA